MTDPLGAEEISELEARLAQLRARQQWITSKPTLRANLYQVAELQWRLGRITDAEFSQVEDFNDDFDFEA